MGESLFIGFYRYPYDYRETCYAGEFHGFRLLFAVGLPLRLGWYFLLSIPMMMLWSAFKESMNLSVGTIHFFITSMSFIFPLIHYAGAEIWGNNCFFGMLVALGVNGYLVDRRQSVLRSTKKP